MTARAATALVIDDESMVRQLVRRMLEPEVCRVLEAGDGETGLRLIERTGEGIDVVLTDLLMPGLDGYDVVDVLSVYRPDLPVACMSGFANHLSVGRHLAVPFIPKPFSIEGLRGLVAPLVARAAALRAQAHLERERAADQRGIAAGFRGAARSLREEAVDLVTVAHELRRARARPRAPR